jgi:mono/diheme cytochrome c family protein
MLQVSIGYRLRNELLSVRCKRFHPCASRYNSGVFTPLRPMRFACWPIIPLISISIFTLPAETPKRAAEGDTEFRNTVQPFIAAHCVACHNATQLTGGLNLQPYTSADLVLKDRERWETVLQKLRSGEMPPKGVPRPAEADLRGVENWIQGEFAREDASARPAPGRVTARRLNRSEYNNTVRDLLGVDFHPADDFPQDDSGYGFDNIGDALSLSPVLMEKYLAAAEKVARTALFGPEKLKPTVVRHQPPYREGTDGGDNSRFLASLPYTITNYDLTGLTLPSALHTLHTFPAEGDYEFRIDPEGNRPRPSEPFKVAVWIDGRQVASVDFEASTNPTAMEGMDETVRAHAPAGEHWVAVSALRQFEGLPVKYGGLNPTAKPEPAPGSENPFEGFQLPEDATPEQRAAFEARRKAFAARGGRGALKPPRITDVSFRVNFIEISGPFNPNTKPSPESLAKIFVCHDRTPTCERRIVSDLAFRAWRRPPTSEEISRLLALAAADRRRGASFEDALAVSIEAMLVSPAFLFRVENDPPPGPQGDSDHRIGQYELASRLSYFLWSSMPDDELLRCAAKNRLREPSVLRQQVTRMLADPKAKALARNFGGQWLQFRALESAQPDPVRFMAFNDYLRLSMMQETELFFENLLRQNGSILDFLNGKYSFLNEELAQYYGIKGVTGAEFRKVDLTGTPRAGVLTQASVLTASSYATRTSVVLRGKWVLENLLNAPVPPPPPNVPTLDETATGTSMSLRQQMEKHRANPICASCHSRMDPIGFGLENFDAIGRWRTKDGNFSIDASGILPDGRKFSGPEELEATLMQNKDAFTQCVTEKMLIYALGRGLETYDRPAVKAIARQVTENHYRISSLVLAIVNSVPFQERKGDRASDDRHT